MVIVAFRCFVFSSFSVACGFLGVLVFLFCLVFSCSFCFPVLSSGFCFSVSMMSLPLFLGYLFVV